MFLEGALRLITEEIQQLDEKGVKIATALHPKGKFGFPPFSIASLLDRSSFKSRLGFESAGLIQAGYMPCHVCRA